MFAQDSGITAFYQLISSIASFKYDMTSMTLFYSSFTPEDFVLVEDLVQFSESGNLNVSFVPEVGGEGWKGSLEGKISEDILKGGIPEPGNDGLFMVCGTKEYKEEVVKVLREMNYSDEEIYSM